MSEPREQDDATEPIEQTKTLELPELLGLVDYQCSNYVRLSSNSADVRLAFGDIGPTGNLVPRSGFALSPIVAKALHKALGRQLEQVEEKSGPIPDGPLEIKVVVPVAKPDSGA
ncbi:MAG: hypothetical protein O2968_10440 [Acidobacteria bacterium]|nr:hypothetical protein [Acidobacteriota bacterium]